jgi:hypothetical protein
MMSDDERLDVILREYGRLCACPEPSRNFMPELWERIEGRRRFTTLVGRFTSGFVTAAVVLSMGLVYLSIPAEPGSLPPATYVEVLDADHATQNLDFFEPVHMDIAEPAAVDEL